MLEVEALTKRYGELDAVRDLSFRIEAGEVLGLVGPNGAGKTTTIRCVAGILKMSAGRIAIDGHDLLGESVAAKRRLGLIPDTPHPFDLLTVLEHLRFMTMAYDVPDAESRFAPLLAELDLLDKQDELASTLSRGMRQKLAIACAFVRDPAVLLFDEPLTGLDPKAIRRIRTAIRRRADEGAAVMISSHLLDLVERICDRVLVLHHGRAVALGTLDDIRRGASAAGDASLEEAFFAITEAPPDEDA